MGTLYKRNGIWHCDYVDHSGRRIRKSTKMRDKQSAAKTLALWEGQTRMIEAGLKSNTKEDELISEHLRTYESYLATKGRGSGHIERTGQLVRNLSLHQKWTKLGHISANGILNYAEHLRETDDRAARTIASVITAIRSFSRWLVKQHSLSVEPTATIGKPSSKRDRRIERRMLLPEEWKWLCKALTGPETEYNRQSNLERQLMYQTAIETGLRSSELRSLKKSSLLLDQSEPHVLVKASLTKNAQLAKQYISDALAAKLRKFVAKRAASAKVFTPHEKTRLAHYLRLDVGDARKLWLETKEGREGKESDFLKSPDSNGEVLDFHALRHTCGAWLVINGINLTEVKNIMRHSSITLTVDTYGHLAPDARQKSRHVLGAILEG